MSNKFIKIKELIFLLMSHNINNSSYLLYLTTIDYFILPIFKTACSKVGSCVLKASVGRVSVDIIGRYSDRHLADILTDTWSIYPLRLGRVSVDMLF